MPNLGFDEVPYDLQRKSFELKTLPGGTWIAAFFVPDPGTRWFRVVSQARGTDSGGRTGESLMDVTVYRPFAMRSCNETFAPLKIGDGASIHEANPKVPLGVGPFHASTFVRVSHCVEWVVANRKHGEGILTAIRLQRASIFSAAELKRSEDEVADGFVVLVEQSGVTNQVRTWVDLYGSED